MNREASPLLRFYRRSGVDHRGRTLLDIRKMTFEELESTHDFIQWLFPLPESSSFNTHAPLLTEDDITCFHSDSCLQGELLASLRIMSAFYGLSVLTTAGLLTIVKSPCFDTRREAWLHPGNHNFLRITRILRCLMICGCEAWAFSLFHCLEEIYSEFQYEIGSRTFSFWQNAIQIDDR